MASAVMALWCWNFGLIHPVKFLIEESLYLGNGCLQSSDSSGGSFNRLHDHKILSQDRRYWRKVYRPG